ncbi:MAG: hypothetical protein IT503_12325 [Burkholderiaceae bacterium]|nr:MAG: hypothetical protein F9K36_18140 [Burkholderiaceae bacterium]MBE7426712.1 hypothetical protein [Ideonella sp.]MCC7286959.1 hypothetical protein [Burkholderiaceae bacterium]
MFEALGWIVGAYALYAAVTGEVFAKAGAWGRTVSRAESPEYFWVVVAIYAGLALALVTVF